jgi:hypothetical protein
MTAVRKDLSGDLRLEPDSARFKPERIGQASAAKRERGASLKAGHAVGRLIDGSREHGGLLAQGHQHLRSPKHV